jgi:ABC-2 type transport system ATP-binding protein
MIETKNLVKSFNGNTVLKGLNIKVNKGEIYGFIGKNGAGKTTTLNILAGLSDFNSGSCILGEQILLPNSHQVAIACGFLQEEPKFYNYMSGLEYLSLFGRINGLTSEENKKRSEELLGIVGLSQTKNKKIASFSRGMKQRLGLAAAMFHNPSVLLLDEPSSALDPEGRQDMIKILSDLKEKGATIMLSTHILSDIEHMCDRVGVLSNGVMALEGKLADILKEYANPGFDIIFANEPIKSEVDALRALPFVKSLAVEQNKVMLELPEPELNANELYTHIGKLKGTVISAFIRRANLDEVFRKVAL